MAKIHEEVIVIKLSKLVKDSGEDVPAIATKDLEDALTAVAQELVGSGVVVEFEQA
jgi:hypothetical protein